MVMNLLSTIVNSSVKEARHKLAQAKQDFKYRGRMAAAGLMSLGLVSVLSGCSKGDDNDPQVPTPDPIESIAYININADDPNASGRAFNITSKNDTIAISNSFRANANGNITIEFDPEDISGIGSTTNRSINSVDLVQILNERNVVKYEFTGVATSTSPSNSNANLTIDERSHQLKVITNSMNSEFRGYIDGREAVFGRVDPLNLARTVVFYTLNPADNNPETTLDSLNITTSSPGLLPIQLTNVKIGTEKEIEVAHEQGSTSASTGSIKVSALNGTSPEQRYRILIENAETGEMLTPIGVGNVTRTFDLEVGTYNFTLEDDGVDLSYDTPEDAKWFPTIIENVEIKADVDGVSQNADLNVGLNQLPNYKRLFIKTFNENRTEASDINVDIIDENSLQEYERDASIEDGYYVNIPFGTTFFAKTSRSGDYSAETKGMTVGISNETVGDVDVPIGVTSFSKKSLIGGADMTANQLNILIPDEWAFPIAATGKVYMHIPENEIKDQLETFLLTCTSKLVSISFL